MLAASYAFVFLAWAFVAGLVVQVYFIGMALFADSGAFGTHAEFGWILHLAPLLVVAAAAIARAGRRAIIQAAVLAAIMFIVPLLPALQSSAPMVAALHPVLALLAFGAAVGVGISATRHVRTRSAVAG